MSLVKHMLQVELKQACLIKTRLLFIHLFVGRMEDIAFPGKQFFLLSQKKK